MPFPLAPFRARLPLNRRDVLQRTGLGGLGLLVPPLLGACGGGGDSPAAQALQGVWGGHFPGSTLRSPTAGIEIHFHRTHNNVFIHRTQPDHVTRATAEVQSQGDAVTLRFRTVHGDDSVFQGRLVDRHTLRGRYTNPRRGESFDMDLVSAVSALPAADTELLPLRPASPAPAASAKAHPQEVTNFRDTVLVIAATDDRGVGYEFAFGLGYYYSPGSARVWGELPPGADAGYVQFNVVAPTAVIQMAFFPDWISFDIYNDSSQTYYLATFEVRLTDFARINPSDPNAYTGIEVYKSSQIGVWPYDVSVARCTMRYIPNFDYNNGRFGNFPIGTDGEVRINDQNYRVPRAVAAMLAGFRGVERLPNPSARQAPVARIEYLPLGPVNRIRFQSTGSKDPAGGPLTYLWNFGDGNTSTEVNATHTFGPGTFTVSLTVTNNQGATATTRVTIYH